MMTPILGQPLPNAQWPMGGHDARHTGRQTYTPATGGTPGTVKWSYDTHLPNLRLQAACAVDDAGRIFFTGDPFGTTDCPFFAIQVVNNTPTLMWEYTIDPDGAKPAGTLGQPAIGKLAQPDPGPGLSFNPPGSACATYWGGFDGRVRCVSNTGVLMWRSKYLGGAVPYGPVIASNGHVFVTVAPDTGPGYLCCFAPFSTGLNVQPLWTVTLDMAADGPPSIYEDGQYIQVICVTNGLRTNPIHYPRVYRVTDALGQPTISRDLSSIVPQVVVWPLIGDGANPTIYVATFNVTGNGTNYITALKMTDLTLKWTSLNPPNDRIEWAQPLNQPPPPQGPFGVTEGSPCLGTDGSIFVGTQEAPDGQFPWHNQSVLLRVTDQLTTAFAEVFHMTPGSGRCDPIPCFGTKTTDGASFVVFATEDGYVYAADPSSGNLLPGWPCHLPSVMDHPNLVLTKDGTILVGTNDGTLYGLCGPN